MSQQGPKKAKLTNELFGRGMEGMEGMEGVEEVEGVKGTKGHGMELIG